MQAKKKTESKKRQGCEASASSDLLSQLLASVVLIHGMNAAKTLQNIDDIDFAKRLAMASLDSNFVRMKLEIEKSKDEMAKIQRWNRKL